MKAHTWNDMVPLGLFSGRLAELTGRALPGGYFPRPARGARGVLPARRVGGRWFVAEGELGEAAAVLGMTAPAKPARRRMN